MRTPGSWRLRLAALAAGSAALASCSTGPSDGAGSAPAASLTPSAASTPPGGPDPGPGRAMLDIPYAQASPAQRLDLYLPQKPPGGPMPLVINVHGGGWMNGDKRDETWNIKRLNEDGFAVASLNYRLSGEARFPAGVQDVKAAVRWLRAHATRYGLDPDRFAASGSSAGGNLVDLIGVTGGLKTAFDDDQLGNPGVSSAVRAVASFFGVADLLTMDRQLKRQGGCPSAFPQHDRSDSPESLWLGHPIQDRPASTAKAGPIPYLKAATRRGADVPPFLLLHGTADCTVPTAQSREFAMALKSAGVPVTLRLVDGAGHGDIKIYDTEGDAVIAFLEQALRG